MQELNRNTSIIKTRILSFLAEEGLRPADFYRLSGAARGVLSQPNGLSEENLLRFFEAFPYANPEWVILGTGKRIRDSSEKRDISPITEATSSRSYEDGRLYQLEKENGWLRERNEKLAGEVAVLKLEVKALKNQGTAEIQPCKGA